jgi:hypothetical protein
MLISNSEHTGFNQRQENDMNTKDWNDWNDWLKTVAFPSHLDRQEIIDNSLLNAADVPGNEQLLCAKATVEMYIDQNCSMF